MAIAEELKLVVRTEVNKAVQDMKKFQAETQRTQGSWKKLLTAVTAFGAAALSIRAATRFIKEAADAYLVQEASVTKLNSALRATGILTPELSSELQDLASELQRTTMYGDETTLAATSLLQSLGKLSGEQLKQAIPLVQDLAAGMGLDLETAASLVGKTLGSTTNALSRYGIVLDATAPPQEKLAALTEQINASFGGMAKALGETFQGRLTRLQNAWGDIKEIIGKFLLEQAEPVITWLLDFLSNAQNIQIITRILNTFGAIFGTVFSTMIIMIKTIVAYYKIWASSLEALWGILKVVFDPSQWGQGKIKEELKTLADNTLEIGKDILDDYVEYGRKFAERWKKAIGNAAEETITVVRNKYQLVTGATTETTEQMLATWEGYFDEFGRLHKRAGINVDNLAGMEERSRKEAKELAGVVGELSGPLFEWSEGVKAYGDGWLTAGASMHDARHEAIALQKGLGKIAEVAEETDLILERFRSTMEYIGKDAFGDVFSALGEALVDSEKGWESFADAAKGAVAKVLEAIGQMALGRAVEHLAAALPPGLQTPGELAAAAAWGAAAAAAFAASGVVKALAEGGVVTRPTLAMVAEKGPEAVIPLNRAGRMGPAVVFNVHGSMAADDEWIRKITKAQQRAASGY